MSNTRSNPRTFSDKDALDLFAQEPAKAAGGQGEIRDASDMIYPDAFSREVEEEELPWPEVSADAMRRLAFIEWRRRLLRIAFAGSLLAIGLFAFVILQRFPLPFSLVRDEPPRVAADADTSPVPSPPEADAPAADEPPVIPPSAETQPPPIDAQAQRPATPAPPIATAPPPATQAQAQSNGSSATRSDAPTLRQPTNPPPADTKTARAATPAPRVETKTPAPAPTNSQPVDSRSARVETAPPRPQNAQPTSGQPTAGAQLTTGAQPTTGAQTAVASAESRAPEQPPAPATTTPTPTPTPQTQAVADPNKTQTRPPDTNRALVPPDVNKVRISPDVNRVIALPSRPKTDAPPAETTTARATPPPAATAPTPAAPASTPSASPASPDRSTPPAIDTAARTNAPAESTTARAVTPPAPPPAPAPPRSQPVTPTPAAAAPPRAEAAIATPSGKEVDSRAINRTLARYRSAFNALDVGATAQVWPTVDKRNLARAFERLKEQQVAFDDCRIDVRDVRAEAVCQGTAQFVPRVGSSSTQIAKRQWTFSLVKVRDEWLIGAVEAR